MSIIAIRRDLSPGAVFFRQRGTRLEYSLDNVTWSTAFDFGSVSGSVAAAQAYSSFKTDVQGFDGTVGSVFPSLVYASNATDRQRDRAMCHAVSVWVDAIVEAATLGASGLLGGVASALEGAAAFFGAGAALAILTPIPGLDEAALGITAAVFAVMAWAVRQVEFIPITFDQDAVDRVKCCIYDAIANQTPTPAVVNDAVQDAECAFAVPGSTEAQILEQIRIALRDRDTYLGLLSIANSVYAGMRPDAVCPCQGLWVKTFDFTGYAMPDDLTITNAAGMTHVPFRGWFTTVRRLPQLDTGESFTMVGLGAEYDMILAAGSTTPYFRTYWPAVSPPAFAPFEDNTTGNGIVWVKYISPIAVKGTIQADFRPSTLGGGNFTLRRLHVWGQGVNPWTTL